MEKYIFTDGGDEFPTILYKYTKIDQYFYSLLINNEIWFSDPRNFNDPYDCNLIYDTKVKEDELKKFLFAINKKEAIIKLIGRALTDKEIEQRAKSLNEGEIKKLLSSVRDKEVSEIGMSCFSEVRDNLLMWSHYANKHTGTCLEFNFSNDLDFLTIPLKVEYPTNFPKTSFIKEQDKIKKYKFMFGTKSRDWEYEKEVRVIKEKWRFTKYRGNIKFKKAALNAIYFGYKTNSEDICTTKTLIRYCGSGYNHVKLYGSKLKEGNFGLEFYEID